MTLPLSRNQTYIAGSTQIAAADLNDLQDMVVGGKHGLITLCIAATSAVPDAASTANWEVNTYYWQGLAGGDNWLSVPLSLPIGARIMKVRAFIKDQTADALTMRLHDGAAGATNSTLKTSAGDASDQTLEDDMSATPEIVASGDYYHIVINGGSHVNHRLYGAEVDYDMGP